MWGGKTEPVVSILCPTYNHRNFIANTLDGFLGQRTSFPFEVIVRDDASTDGTTEIVRDYERRYPRVVRPIVEPRNTFSRGVNFMPPLAANVRGRFVAICGGDDHWIDAGKLETQVAALEGEPNAVLTSTASATVRDGRIVALVDFDSANHRSFRRYAMTLASTWLFRADCVNLTHKVFNEILCEDLLIKSQADAAGETLHFDDRVTTMYHSHGESIWSGAGGRVANYKTLQIINSGLWIAQYHRRAGNASMARRQMRYAAGRWLDHLKTIGPGEVWMFWMATTALALKRLLRRRRKSS